MEQQMIVIYVTCMDITEAKKIGTHVMQNRLAPCYNIIQNTYSAAFWPPKTGKIEEVSGASLLIKSINTHFAAIEAEVKTIHSDITPCIFSLPVSNVSEAYFKWFLSEMDAV
jgi:uncharacterized protein involved in tolerance to divalent cations